MIFFFKKFIFFIFLIQIFLLFIVKAYSTKHVTYDDVKRLIASGQTKEALKKYEQEPDPYTATLLVSHTYKTQKDLSLCFCVYDILKKVDQAKPDRYVPANICLFYLHISSFFFSTLIHACQTLGGSSHISSVSVLPTEIITLRVLMRSNRRHMEILQNFHNLL